MAGTLTISTLSDGTNSTSATNLVRGTCVAWMKYTHNGSGGGTISASYNVSSVTNSGSANYQMNLTNALVDANWCVQVFSSQTGIISNQGGGQTYSASSIPFQTITSNTQASYTPANGTYSYVAVFR